jgi:predicted heme/steroid binding protein
VIFNFAKLEILTHDPATLNPITRAQLSLRNGQDKPEIWIAYKGLVYDVTNSKMWRLGKHYEHWAGQDLTDELEDAPHTEIVFERLQIIGRLT